MIRVERKDVPEPGILKKPFGKDKKTELEMVTDFMGYTAKPEEVKPVAKPKKKKGFEFTRYSQAEVKDALEKLFHGKCAYCETYYSSSQPVDVEHFRPKAAIDDDKNHPGYWWLAMEWSNLLPSCIDCNRKRLQIAPDSRADLAALAIKGDLDRTKPILTGKACAFPLAEGGIRCEAPGGDLDKEKALLLDPTRDQPEHHLLFHVGIDIPISLVGPARVEAVEEGAQEFSEKGIKSIQVYGLNRLGLVQARTRVLRELQYLYEMAVSLTEAVLEIEERNKVLGGNGGQDSGHVEFNNRLLPKLRILRDMTRERLLEMAKPEAPYSAMAQTWLKKILNRQAVAQGGAAEEREDLLPIP